MLQIYGLPKVHKDNIPIVCTIGSVTHNLAKELCRVLIRHTDTSIFLANYRKYQETRAKDTVILARGKPLPISDALHIYNVMAVYMSKLTITLIGKSLKDICERQTGKGRELKKLQDIICLHS